VSLKGLGWEAARSIVENRPPGGYTSIQHFIDSTPNQPVTGGASWAKKQTLNGVCKVLFDSNAFRSVGNQ
jgi:hypothetical protein